MEALRDTVAGQPPCWTVWNPFHKETLQKPLIPNWGHMSCCSLSAGEMNTLWTAYRTQTSYPLTVAHWEPANPTQA